MVIMLKLKKGRAPCRELLIEICNKCHLHCKFCSSSGRDSNNRFLDINLIKQIIKDAKELDVSIIQLSGGEPFTHPSFSEICNFIKKNNFDFIVYTSGNVIKNNKLKPITYMIMKKLRKYKITLIRFNLQSHIQEIHNYLTDLNSFKNTIESIKRAIDMGIPSEIHLIPMKKNYKDLDKTMQFLLKLGVFKVKFLRFVPHGRGLKNKKDLKLNHDEFNELMDCFSDLKRKYGDFIEIGSAFNEKSNNLAKNLCKKCQIGKSKIVVTPNANIYPCVSTKNIDFFDFNLTNHSLKQILTSYSYKSKVYQFYSLINNVDNKCPTQAYIRLKNRAIMSDLSNTLMEKREIII